MIAAAQCFWKKPYRNGPYHDPHQEHSGENVSLYRGFPDGYKNIGKCTGYECDEAAP